MSQRNFPPRDPRVPPRAARHRSSVIGPPPGIEAGAGYISPTTSPTAFQFPRPPPRTSQIPMATGRGRTGRPDPEIFDPIMEEPPIPPPRSSRRRTRRESDGPSVMFYPSSTTISSMDSESLAEPMPFFRVDPQMSPPRGSPRLPRTTEERGEPRPLTTSTTSSGVLGMSAIEVDPDTENDSDEDGSSVSSESFDRLARNVSLVRRGQARIIRNPSATRRSVIPEVKTQFFESIC